MNSGVKVAVITGAGSGIGRSVAVALAREGYALALSGRRLAALEETAAAVKGAGGRAIVVPTDVTDGRSVEALFARVEGELGRLDLLFNNAGISAPPVLFEDLSLDQWRAVVDSSLTGAFLCSREAFRMMKAQKPQGGRIINNGSISAHTPRPNSAPYTAAKHGMSGLTKATALDGRKYDIACGQIDIGNAATDMTAKVSQGALQANGSLLSEETMDVENVARSVVYMASLPLNANVMFLTVVATKMPYIGRG